MKLCLDHMADNADGHVLAYLTAEQMIEEREPDEDVAAAFEDLLGATVPILLALVDYPVLIEAWRNENR